MGIKQSKKSDEMIDPMVNADDDEPDKITKIGDENNMALLRFCINNKEFDITTALESGTDLASPYNGVPLIVSAVLALLNDTDHERFKRNWDVLAEHFNNSVPVIELTDIRLTNWTENQTLTRSSCYPVIHIGELSDSLVETTYRNKTELKLGKLKKCNLKNILLFVMTNIQTKMKDISQSKNANVYQGYRGSVTQVFESTIYKNTKYLIDNINEIEKNWNTDMNYQEYYNKYNDEYTMESIPYAVPASS